MLLEGATALGCPISDAQCDTLLAYVALLGKWNQVYNLTAIRDAADMLTQHILDSLSVVAPLTRFAESRPLKILDVGSGGGLPAVVIATVRPDFAVTSVDAVAKKAGFVQQAALELGLKNLQSVHSRIEKWSGSLFDVVISRAFASLSTFASLTQGRLAPGGVWVAMKGRRPDAEIAQLPSTVDVFHVEQLHVPGLDAERVLVWMRPGTP